MRISRSSRRQFGAVAGAVAVMALSLAGCSGDGDSAASSTGSAPTSATSTDPQSATPSEPPTGDRTSLTSRGLGAYTIGATVGSALRAAADRGDGPVSESCPAYTVADAELGTVLFFADGGGEDAKIVAVGIGSGSSGEVQTDRGIRLGSNMAEFKAAYPDARAQQGTPDQWLAGSEEQATMVKIEANTVVSVMVGAEEWLSPNACE